MALPSPSRGPYFSATNPFGEFQSLDDLQRRKAEQDALEPIVLGSIAKEVLRDKDLAHMTERLRDLAALAMDAADPHLEMDVFRLQLQVYRK